jgi:hypothetical protein
MGALSAWHLLNLPILAVIAFVLIFPVSRILKRLGWNPWFSLLSVVPLLNIGLLWAVAYAQWPAVPGKQS